MRPTPQQVGTRPAGTSHARGWLAPAGGKTQRARSVARSPIDLRATPAGGAVPGSGGALHAGRSELDLCKLLAQVTMQSWVHLDTKPSQVAPDDRISDPIGRTRRPADRVLPRLAALFTRASIGRFCEVPREQSRNLRRVSVSAVVRDVEMRETFPNAFRISSNTGC
jgi:hypothetical protein